MQTVETGGYLESFDQCGPYPADEFLSRLIWEVRLLSATHPTTRYLPDDDDGAKYSRGNWVTQSGRSRGGCLIGEALVQAFPELALGLQFTDRLGTFGIAELVSEMLPISGAPESLDTLWTSKDIRWLTAVQTAESADYTWLRSVNSADSIYVNQPSFDSENENRWAFAASVDDY